MIPESLHTHQEQFDAKYQRIMTAFLGARDVKTWRDALTVHGLCASDFSSFVHSPAGTTTLESLSKAPQTYRYQLGLFGAELPKGLVPERIQDRLGIQTTDAAFTVNPLHPDWWLCGDSEEFMANSIRNKAVVVLNDGNLVVKYTGMLTALCIKSFSTDHATFIEGNWYSPHGNDETLRRNLERTFIEGHGTTRIDKGTWALMRPLNQDSHAFVGDWAKKAAEQPVAMLPETVLGEPRAEFRRKYKDIMDRLRNDEGFYV